MTQSSIPKDQTKNTTNSQASNKENINRDNNLLTMNTDQMIDAAFRVLHKLYLQGRRIISYISSEFGGKETLDAITSWCVQHPDIAICILVFSIIFFLPFLIFIGFGLVTMAVTFTGILVLEGTLLTIMLMILLAFVAGWAIAIAIFAIVAYFGFSHIYDLFGLQRHRDTFIKFVQQNRHRMDAEESAHTATT